MQQQMTFVLPYRQTFDREDFIVAPCNIDAVTWMDLQGCWSSHAFLVYGPKGCGKTHLSYMFSKIHIDAKDLTEDFYPTDPKIVVENIDETVNEKALFHLFNWTREQNIGLLMTARKIPNFQLPDLTSRILMIQKVPILPPDDDLIFGMLAKVFLERNIAVDANVLEYATHQTERSFEAVHALIDAADGLALSQNRRITIPIIKQTLADLRQKKQLLDTSAPEQYCADTEPSDFSNSSADEPTLFGW